jgi:hypothetical protein
LCKLNGRFQCASQHCKSGIACKPRIPPRSDTPTLFSVPGSAWRDRTQITAWVSARESTCVYAALDMHAIGSVSVCYELEKAYENKNSVRRVDVRLLYTVCFRALIRVLRSKGPGSQCGHDDHVFTHRAPDRRTGAAGSAGEGLMRFPLPWSHYVRLQGGQKCASGRFRAIGFRRGAEMKFPDLIAQISKNESPSHKYSSLTDRRRPCDHARLPACTLAHTEAIGKRVSSRSAARISHRQPN